MTGRRGRDHAVSASAAVAPTVTGPPAPVTVLAAFDRAVYLDHPDGLVALVTSDGVHLPNALVLNRHAGQRPFTGCHPRQRGRLGDRRLRLGALDVRVTRWWQPRPRLRPVPVDRLRATVDAATRCVEAVAAPTPADLAAPLGEVTRALVAADAGATVSAARGLLGRGPGLTPAGDDVLAGLLAGTQLLAPAVAGAVGAGVAATARQAGGTLADLAGDATTPVSAALLRHAARGEVAAPAAEVLRALTGRGELAAAVDRLRQVGSTSGGDLLLGLLAAADVAVRTGAAAHAAHGAYGRSA